MPFSIGTGFGATAIFGTRLPYRSRVLWRLDPVSDKRIYTTWRPRRDPDFSEPSLSHTSIVVGSLITQPISDQTRPWKSTRALLRNLKESPYSVQLGGHNHHIQGYVPLTPPGRGRQLRRLIVKKHDEDKNEVTKQERQRRTTRIVHHPLPHANGNVRRN